MTEPRSVFNVDGYQSTFRNHFHASCSLEFPPSPRHLDVKGSYTCGFSVKGDTSSFEITLEIPSYGCQGTMQWEVILQIKCVSIQQPFRTGEKRKKLHCVLLDACYIPGRANTWQSTGLKIFFKKQVFCVLVKESHMER